MAEVEPTPKSNHKRKKWISILIIAFLIIGIAVLLFWWFFLRLYVSTDDAYVNGNMVNVASRQKGTVIAYFTEETQFVREGQLLIQLDPTDYAIAFEEQKAALALAARRVQQLWNQVEISQASVADAQAKLELAQKQYQDRQALIGTAISQEEYEQYQTSQTSSEETLNIAKQQLQNALAARGNQPKEMHPEIEQAKLRLIFNYIALQRCNIYSPVSGFVGKRSVQIGMAIAADQFLMSIVPLNYIWVDANFKETQLTDIRMGQPAQVTADIYGSGVKYVGKVIGLTPGSGSVFSLLPAQNATGNWIKIVQRIPVRIALDCETLENYPLVLGLSTEVRVSITDTSGPRLSTVDEMRAISSTRIYEIPLEPVYTLIDQIIKENLQ